MTGIVEGLILAVALLRYPVDNYTQIFALLIAVVPTVRLVAFFRQDHYALANTRKFGKRLLCGAWSASSLAWLFCGAIYFLVVENPTVSPGFLVVTLVLYIVQIHGLYSLGQVEDNMGAAVFLRSAFVTVFAGTLVVAPAHEFPWFPLNAILSAFGLLALLMNARRFGIFRGFHKIKLGLKALVVRAKPATIALPISTLDSLFVVLPYFYYYMFVGEGFATSYVGVQRLVLAPLSGFIAGTTPLAIMFLAREKDGQNVLRSMALLTVIFLLFGSLLLVSGQWIFFVIGPFISKNTTYEIGFEELLAIGPSVVQLAVTWWGLVLFIKGYTASMIRWTGVKIGATVFVFFAGYHQINSAIDAAGLLLSVNCVVYAVVIWLVAKELGLKNGV